MVLTLTSWIGYHNSANRPRYLIGFPNLPLLQFLLDIFMVVLYWLTAVTAERVVIDPDGVRHVESASASQEAMFVAIAFVLYVVWDIVGLAIRRNDNYQDRPLTEDDPQRRRVTWWFASGLSLSPSEWSDGIRTHRQSSSRWTSCSSCCW